MKVLIIEDEAPASRGLQKLLREIDPAINILTALESVENAVKWFSENEAPDLVFMDIQLSDGISFDIFKKINIVCPVIFTTAYDEYAIQAFKVNSIDYLLKPIDESKLRASLEKYQKINERYSVQYKASELTELLKTFNPVAPSYKSRFIIKNPSGMVIISADESVCFFLENKITYVLAFSGKKHIIDNALDELEDMLDPEKFFRANRQYIINVNAIESIKTQFSGKLKVELKIKTGGEIIVSKERAPIFRQWLDK